jgi:hypothetical protein
LAHLFEPQKNKNNNIKKKKKKKKKTDSKTYIPSSSSILSSTKQNIGENLYPQKTKQKKEHKELTGSHCRLKFSEILYILFIT